MSVNQLFQKENTGDNAHRFEQLYIALCAIGNNPEWQVGALRSLASAIEAEQASRWKMLEDYARANRGPV